MKNIFLFLAIVAFNISAVAQEKKTEKDNSWQKFFSKITIQNEIDPLPDKPDPALFQLTFPKNGEDSWLVDGAIGLKLKTKLTDNSESYKGNIRWTFTPLFSYHRNTLVNEEQYNWQTGMSVSFENMNRVRPDSTRIGHYISMGLKYSRNVIDTVQSALFTGQYDIYRSGKHGLNLGTNTYTQTPFLNYFSITPSYQFQYNFKANNENLKGLIFRPQLTASYELSSNLEKVQENTKKKVSLTLEYTARYDVANSTGVREYYTQLFKGGLNLYLLNDPMKVTISGSFNYGSDPAQGLKEQQFWLIGLKLQK